jgi:hypothetical protein
MKKIILASTLLFLGFSSQSQVLISLLFGDKLNSDGVEFGLEGGYNYSQTSNFESSKRLGNFNLGFYFDIRLKGRLSLSTGVLVKSSLGLNSLSNNDLITLGAKTYTEDGTYSQKIGYFLVPMMLRHKFKNKLYLEGGVQMGLMNKSWIEFKSKNGDTESKIKQFNTENINRIDVGLIIGTGYLLKKTKGMTIGVKYYYGLLDVYKNISNTKNSSLFLKINVPIGTGKKDRTEVAE